MSDQVSTRETTAIVRCFEAAGGDSFDLLRDSPYNRKFLTTPHHSVPAEVWVNLIQRAEKFLGDPNFAYKAGRYYIMPRKAWGVARIILRLFSSPEKFYENRTTLAGGLKSSLKVDFDNQGPGEYLITLQASATEQRYGEECRWTRGILEGIPTIFGLPLARVEEKTCQVPLERCGKIDGFFFAVNEEGNVIAYADEDRTIPVRDLGTLNADGSFILGGVKYGADACRYRVRYKRKDTNRKKIKKRFSPQSSGSNSVAELEQVNRELEKQFDEIQQRELVFRRLSEVGMTIARQRSLDKLLQMIAYHTTEIADAVITRVFLLDNEDSIRHYEGAAAVGKQAELTHIHNLVVDPALLPENMNLSRHPRAREIIGKATPTVFENLRELFAPFWPEETCQRFERDNTIKKIVLVPLRSEEKPLGLIFIVSADNIETEALQLLANMAAQAITNTRRWGHIRAQKERLEKLREIQMKTAMTRDVDSLLDYLVGKSCELSRSIMVRMILFDPLQRKVKNIHSSFASEFEPVLKSFKRRALLPDKNLDVDEHLLWERMHNSCKKGTVRKFSSTVELMAGLWPDEFCRIVDNEMRIKEIGLMSLIKEEEIIGVMIFVASGGLDEDLLLMLTAQTSQLLREAEYLRTIEAHRNELEDKVKERTRLLEEANRELKESQSIIIQQEKMASLGQLAAGVAHELNNPLGFIYSNLHSMKEYVSDIKAYLKDVEALVKASSQGSDHSIGELACRIKEERDTLGIDDLMEDIGPLTDECLAGIERAKEIVLNLGNFSRPGQAAPSMVDLNAGIDNTISVIWNDIKYRARLHKDFGELPTITGYPQKLNQVIMSLLLNAAQSFEENGDIWIRTRQVDDFLEIEIEDNGKGIKEEVMGRIFEPFFTTRTVGHGMGLGLSIAYGIIKEHGGEILVESRFGEGAKFTVRLPGPAREGTCHDNDQKMLP